MKTIHLSFMAQASLTLLFMLLPIHVFYHIFRALHEIVP
jgi:hypothetical protein